MVKKKKISKAKMKQDKELKLFVGVLVALGLFYLVNIFGTFSVLSGINEKIFEREELNRPANLEIIQILDNSCVNCVDLSDIIISLGSFDSVKIADNIIVSYSSTEGAKLIEEFGIQKIPALIIKGEIDKSNVENIWGDTWDKKEDVILFDGDLVPYIDLETGDTIGLVSLTSIVDISCEECVSMNETIDFFRRAGVKFSEEKTIEYEEAQDLINEFEVKRVPAIIVSSNILEYPTINQIWEQLNATEKDGFYALHSTAPPYLDLNSSGVRGLVEVFYLNDNSCLDCYDVNVNKQILERNFGIYLVNETTLNISSEQGIILVDKYNITEAPMIILSPEVRLYEQFNNIWEDIGTIEEDGWYVMRNPSVLGKTKVVN